MNSRHRASGMAVNVGNRLLHYTEVRQAASGVIALTGRGLGKTVSEGRQRTYTEIAEHRRHCRSSPEGGDCRRKGGDHGRGKDSQENVPPD